MKKIVQLFVIVLVAGAFTSCGKKVKPSSQITTETYNLGGYDKIVISDALNADIDFTTGTEQVSVEANSNIHPYIITEVSGNTLFIRIKNNVRIKGSYTANIHISVANFSGLDMSGASNCTINSTWNNSFVNLRLSGASHLAGSIDSDNLTLDASGASSIDLSGINANVDMELSGASNFEYYSFICDNLNAKLSGASSAKITVNNTLNLDLSGASSLKYKGNGTIEEIHTSGASTVEHL